MVEILRGESNYLKIVKNKLKNIKRPYFIATVGVTFFLMTVIIFVALIKSPQDKFSVLQLKKSDAILRELGNIDSQIQQASQKSDPKEVQTALKAIEKDIISIQHDISDLAKSSDMKKLSTQIESVQNNVDEKISDIKKTVSLSAGSKDYLQQSSLPFSMVSVDIIGGEPYVSVNYKDHVLPLGVSDSLAGWRLISADYVSDSAEFVNEKEQFVKASLV